MPTTSHYLDQLSSTLAVGDATEHTHRPALKEFLESFDGDHIATNEPKKSAVGAPDFDVKSIRAHGPISIGKIEAKDLGADLIAIEKDSEREKPRTRDGQQLRRYRAAFQDLILTDYLNFRWYSRGQLRIKVSLGSASGGNISRDLAGQEAVESTLTQFLASSPQKITSSRTLANRMAKLAALIRVILENGFENESLSTATTGLLSAFRETLVADLSEEQFSDMLAQTIAYGLFAARIQHDDSEPFTRQTAAKSIPRTNPFLRGLFSYITGADLDFEPHADVVGDLAQLLNDADIPKIMAGFGSEKRDPIVHFYETFLSEYDPNLRESRGVYYTPMPVVSFIVRSIDELLKRDFGISDGVADSSRVAPNGIESHRVLVLDPAVGTGTFLYEVIDLIRADFIANEKSAMWPAYVREHLLPRLFGFELMMAPYAISHLKIALQLAGHDLPESQRSNVSYDFASDERIGVYLTNALEPGEIHSTLNIGRYISDEANAATSIKTSKPIMVVTGNPPYYGQSANASKRRVFVRKVKGKDHFRTELTAIGALLQNYSEIDGVPLREKNSKWLQDDYVKFIRFGQSRIESTSSGILAYVTNHTYLDAPTFRGMRWSLLSSFDHVYVLDLHGSIRRRERNPAGGPDENVFDQIQQGVAIAIYVKTSDSTELATVHYADLWGTREEKYPWLEANTVDSIIWESYVPTAPFFSFRPEDPATKEEWLEGHSLVDIFTTYTTGMQTSHDDLAIDTRRERLVRRIADFLDSKKTDGEVRAKYFPGKPRVRADGQIVPLGDTDRWKLPKQRALLQKVDLSSFYRPITFRPFDDRTVLFHTDAVERAREAVMRHMIDGDNLGLISARSNKSAIQDQFFVSRSLTEVKTGEASTGSILFPLWLYADQTKLVLPGEPERRANISESFARSVQDALGLQLTDSDRGDLVTTVGPRDLLDYIYGVVHSRTYRVRYETFLRSEYARISVTRDPALFRVIREYGRRLIELHVLDVPDLANLGPARSTTAGSNLVEAIPPSKRWEATDELGGGRLLLNYDGARDGGPQSLPNVDEDVWLFEVGGHHVLKKWLDARVGDVLTYDEIVHLIKVVNAIRGTIDIQDEIEEAVTDWPLK